MKKKHDWYYSIWTIKHFRKGKVIWQESKRNSLVDEGEEAILESFFRNASAYSPSTFYLRLCNDTLLETDNLSLILNEPSGNGYSAQEIERSTIGFPSKSLDSGDYMLESKTVTFTASGGDIGPINTVYLATSSDNSGKLIAFVETSMSRTILDGDSMEVSLKIKLS